MLLLRSALLSSPEEHIHSSSITRNKHACYFSAYTVEEGRGAKMASFFDPNGHLQFGRPERQDNVYHVVKDNQQRCVNGHGVVLFPHLQFPICVAIACLINYVNDI